MALILESVDCAKRVRIQARLPVSNSDRLWEVTPVNRVNLRTYRTDYGLWHREMVPSRIEPVGRY